MYDPPRFRADQRAMKMSRRARSEYRSNMGSLCVTDKGQAIHVASPSRTEFTVRSRILVCSEGISAQEATIDGRYVDPPGGTAAVHFPVLAFELSRSRGGRYASRPGPALHSCRWGLPLNRCWEYDRSRA